MGIPLDEKGPLPCPFCGGPARTFQYNGTTQASCAALHTECAGTDVVAPVAMWNHRHLSTVALPDGLEVVAWRCDVTGNPVGTDTRMIGAHPCTCQGCRAQSALEAMRAERDSWRRVSERLEEERSEQAEIAANSRGIHMENKRLTEENEAFRGMADGYGKLDADYAIAERRADAAEARIKALEEALRPFAEHKGRHGDIVRDLTSEDFEAARAALSQENADGK